MNLTFENICQHLISPGLSETDIIRLLKDLYDVFNHRRDDLGSYVDNPDLVSAYASFYMPTNLKKMSWFLEKLPLQIINELRDSTFIDFGCGPGTYTLGFLDFFRNEFKGKVWCVDLSPHMLNQAKKLVEGFFPDFLEVDFKNHLPALSEEKRTLFFGNSLNEMKAKNGILAIEKIKPDVILFIEPGTIYSYNIMMEMRDYLLANGYDNHFPCPGAGECPLRNKEREDWCHQILKTTHDPSIERISQLIQRDRRTMPLIAHAYSKNLVIKNEKARVVRFLNETKFSFEFLVCTADEGLKEIKIEIMKKDLGKNRTKEFKNFEVGNSLSFDIVKKVHEDHWRVKVHE